MDNHDPLIFIAHILESIALIEKYTQDKAKEDFLNSIELQDQIVRRLEIVGEAVRNFSKTLKESYPNIPWKEIAGMRDVLIHEYFGIDLAITWTAATVGIPKLKRQILAIKKDLQRK